MPIVLFISWVSPSFVGWSVKFQGSMAASYLMVSKSVFLLVRELKSRRLVGHIVHASFPLQNMDAWLSQQVVFSSTSRRPPQCRASACAMHVSWVCLLSSGCFKAVLFHFFGMDRISLMATQTPYSPSSCPCGISWSTCVERLGTTGAVEHASYTCQPH